MVFIQLSKLT